MRAFFAVLLTSVDALEGGLRSQLAGDVSLRRFDRVHKDGSSRFTSARTGDTEECDMKSDECNTMCRWLKLTQKDNGECAMFEWQLKTCDYILPEDRSSEDGADPLDCAVNLLRTKVLSADVGSYMQRLDSCVHGLPPEVNATCNVAVALVENEIKDWNDESTLKAEAADMKGELEKATEQAKNAMKTRTGEQEAVDELSEVLSKSEKLEGHYLVDEVHRARRALDKLAPIPAIRGQLKAAMQDGSRVYKSLSLFRAKEAIVWLDVAIRKAEKFQVGAQVPEAKEMLKNLTAFKAAVLDLQDATFAGNVSFSTKSGVHESVISLQSAIQRAKAAGLENQMVGVKNLLEGLQDLDVAVINAKNATEEAEEILKVAGNKGKTGLLEAVGRLNSTVERAHALGLGDNSTVMEAVAALDKLKYVKHARVALHTATLDGRKVLEDQRDDLSDNAEEAATDALKSSIHWAEDVGIVNGLEVAKDVSKNLTVAERTKEAMALALANGNASLEAKSHPERAIKMLESSIEGSKKEGQSAGVPKAEEQLISLRALMAAWGALKEGSAAAKSSLDRRAGYSEAADKLRAGIDAGHKVGLTDAEAVAGQQLEKLQAFAKADDELAVALAEKPLEPLPPGPVEVDDPEPESTFHRDGYRVEDLPDEPNSGDDGDSDFKEHMKALEEGIAASKKNGVIDPEMQAELADMQAKNDAYEMLQDAVDGGEKAFKAKRHLEHAITELTGATREAQEIGLTLGLSKAMDLLAKLNIIQPAKDELQAAILQANVSVHTVSGLDRAAMRLEEAVEVNRKLELFGNLKRATQLRDQLLQVKEIYVRIRAACTQGEIALDSRQGEEAAITELNESIEAADKIDLHKGMRQAVDILHELMGLNAKKQQAQAAISPKD